VTVHFSSFPLRAAGKRGAIRFPQEPARLGRLGQISGGIRTPMIDKENERRGEGEEGRTQEEQDRAAEGGGTAPRDPDEPRVPSSIPDRDDLIDRASEDSFPASDPPAYWQRPSTDRSEDEPSDSPAQGRPRKDG